MVDRIERMNYFTGELLTTEDFKTEQLYQMQMLQYHNANLHTWGIAQGLNVIWEPNSKQVTVTPGVAVDSLGREIVLLENKALGITHVTGNPLYYLTITYREALSNYEEEASGVKGYKRLVQDPDIQLRLTDAEPSLNILLGIVLLNADQTVANVLLEDGETHRVYCGLNVGHLGFRVDRVPSEQLPNIHVEYNSIEDNHWLAFTAPRADFSGNLTSQGQVGIGTDELSSALTVRTIRLQGKGTLSSGYTTVTADQGYFYPPLQLGDVIIIADASGKVSQSQVVTALNSKGSVEVDGAFAPPLQHASYFYQPAAIAQIFTRDDSEPLVEINNDGSIALGRAEDTHGFALNVTKDGKVGIGIGQPGALLEVGGTVKATEFIGDGSKLSGVNGLWSRSTDDPDDIYYDKGYVGIGVAKPTATLDVKQNYKRAGSGIISTKAGEALVYGEDGTEFLKELSLGDSIIVGTYPEDISNSVPSQSRVVINIDDKKLTVNAPFDPPLTDAKYHILVGALAQFGSNLQGNLALSVKANNQVGINLDLPMYTLDVGGDIHASGDFVVDGNIDIEGGLSCQFLKVGPDAAKLNASLGVVGNTLISTSATATPTFSVIANKVGINTISPAQALDVVGNIQASGSLTIGQGAAPVLKAVDAKVGINTAAPAHTLDVSGDIHASNGFVTEGTIKGGAASTQSVTASDFVRIGAKAAAAALGVDGSVSMFADITLLITITKKTGITSLKPMPTDGFLVGVLSTDLPETFTPGWATVVASTKEMKVEISGGSTLYKVDISDDKDSKATLYGAPVNNTFILPVRAQQNWSIEYSVLPKSQLNPTLRCYWVPLGQSSGVGIIPLTNVKSAMVANSSHITVPFASQLSTTERINTIVLVYEAIIQQALPFEKKQALISAISQLVCLPAYLGIKRSDDATVTQQKLEALVDVIEQLAQPIDDATRKQLLVQLQGLLAIESTTKSSVILKCGQAFINTLAKVLNLPLTAQNKRLLLRALAGILGNGTRAQ